MLELVTAHNAHLFPRGCSLALPWRFEISHRASIYTTEIGRHDKPGLFPTESQLVVPLLPARDAVDSHAALTD